MLNTITEDGSNCLRATALLSLVLLLSESTFGESSPAITETADVPDLADVSGDTQERLAAARLRYQQSLQNEMYREAADAGKLYIDALLSSPDYDNQEWGSALTRLGEAQRLSGNNEAAVENFHHALTVLEEQSDRLNVALVEPLLGMSRAYIDMRDYRYAIESLERAIHIQQVNDGLHSMQQGKPLSDLSEMYFQLGNHRQAIATQQAHLSVYNRKFPGDDLNKLPALYSHASMLHRAGRLIESQTAYRRIISMIERVDGSRSLHLLPAIYRISELLSNNHIVDGYDGNYAARRFLQRAVYIAKKHDDATPLQRADAYIAMGDYLSRRTMDRAAALRRYQNAWTALSTDDRWLEERDERFSEPTLLNVIPASTAPVVRNQLMLSATSEEELRNRILLRYDVDRLGSAENISVVEGDPSGYWDPIVVAHVKKFIHRPRLENGEAVQHSNLTFEIRH